MKRTYAPEEKEFLVPCECLDKLRPRYLHAVNLIRNAIDDNRPILVRHHSDCDGYTSGVALERAILAKIIDKKGRQYAWKYFKRLPSKTPYYGYVDAVKDMANAVTDRVFYDKLMPLVIVVDNGSSEEDYTGLKKAKLHGCQLLVVDHHHPGEMKDGKVKVDEVLDGHINPHLEGYDGFLCTGMLCVELARMIYKNPEDVSHLGAIAGIGDMCRGPEFEAYKKIAASAGYDEEHLKKTSAALNWEGYHLGFYDGKQLIHVLLGKRTKEQEAMVELSHDEILANRVKYLEAVKKYAVVEDLGPILYVKLDTEITTQWSTYFSAGKVTSLAFGHFKEAHPDKKVVLAGHGPTFITFRAEKGILNESGAPFDVNSICETLQKKIPYGIVDGGGHAVAGALRFLGAAKAEVMETLASMMKGMK